MWGGCPDPSFQGYGIWGHPSLFENQIFYLTFFLLRIWFGKIRSALQARSLPKLDRRLLYRFFNCHVLSRGVHFCNRLLTGWDHEARFHLLIVICNVGLKPPFMFWSPVILTYNSVFRIFNSPQSEFLSNGKEAFADEKTRDC